MSPADIPSSARGNFPGANQPDMVLFSSSTEVHPARPRLPKRTTEDSATRAQARKAKLVIHRVVNGRLYSITRW
jgi:hypothetical protein